MRIWTTALAGGLLLTACATQKSPQPLACEDLASVATESITIGSAAMVASATKIGGADVDAGNFPDHAQAGPLRMALQYRFQPGNEDDGVTAIVPLHTLNQLQTDSFGWLVPGLLAEKVTAMVRSLPKSLRVHFVPVPEHAERALQLLQPGKGSLEVQLAAALQRTGGVVVPADAFREELLPAHLRTNYAVVDEAGKVIDRSRDLRALQQRHGQSAGQTFRQLAQQAP